MQDNLNWNLMEGSELYEDLEYSLNCVAISKIQAISEMFDLHLPLNR